MSTTKTANELTSDIRNYIDHIFRGSMSLEDAPDKIRIGDENRQIHHHVRLFRNHAERDDYNTALIMLAITRNRIYQFVALALKANVDFNITEATALLHSIEQYAYRYRVQDAIKIHQAIT
jgi:hypothetical protein